MAKQNDDKKKKYVNPFLAWGLILLNLGIAIAIFLIKFLPEIQEALNW